MEITLQQHSPTAVKLNHPNFNIIVDRPIEKGGNAEGLMGGQYLLVGIGGCFASNLLAALAARNIIVHGLTITVNADITNQAPARFNPISIQVSYASISNEQSLPKLIKIAEKACIAINTIKLTTTLTVKPKENEY